jgi:CRISPR-associated protein Cmr4
MYERAMLMFLYADSPVHFGAGVSLGAVDLPVQRERHTGYPMAQGSGLKGALRHHLERASSDREDERARIRWVFGPDGEGQGRDHAGAAAFGDGRLLLFPVRSLAGTFAYCTSAVALGRLRRDLALKSMEVPWEPPDSPPEGKAWVTRGSRVVISDRLVVEDFDVEAEGRDDVTAIAEWIAGNALPQAGDAPPQRDAFNHFRNRVKSHLALLGDDLFGHLARLATVVEPHVKIDDVTGTAAGTAFFYAEHLPPDSLLWSLVGVARPHAAEDRREELQALGLGGADSVEQYLRDRLDGRPVQAGAEATTGRGLMTLRLL